MIKKVGPTPHLPATGAVGKGRTDQKQGDTLRATANKIKQMAANNPGFGAGSHSFSRTSASSVMERANKAFNRAI